MFRLALELLEQVRFDPSMVFSHEMPFRQFGEAYGEACNYEDGVVKVLLTFPEQRRQNHIIFNLHKFSTEHVL